MRLLGVTRSGPIMADARGGSKSILDRHCVQCMLRVRCTHVKRVDQPSPYVVLERL
jgi:hypothetical protein